MFAHCDRLPVRSCQCRAGRRTIGSNEIRPPVATFCPAGPTPGSPSRFIRRSITPPQALPPVTVTRRPGDLHPRAAARQAGPPSEPGRCTD